MKTSLSPIIAGTMNWGIWGKNLSRSEMSRCLMTCVENHITTFDHADIYGDYTTESEFGNAFTETGLSRDQIQLISKCGIQHTKGRPNVLKHYDYSKEYIIWSVENSLKNLQTDYLDLLLLHRPSPLMQADEIAEAIEKLKSEGKIIDFGLSNFTPSQTELIRQKTAVGYNQIQFSVTHHQAMLDGSLYYMQLHHITPMSWNPLGTVFREDIEQTRRVKKVLDSLMGKYNVTADILLLAWILKHPAKIIPVVGTATLSRIQALSNALSVHLDTIDWFALWTESMGNKVP
ncbi:aldo/keto reductase [Flavobacterium aciduliphilum]|uniref:Putative oxidoreductase n=1 Tax=Flavobacterium aciduliphilum TaxID=1101402 RepID=A0A328YDL1_9FLAO|nr:aldo/keto reductase [Flavobacterium aciduliphilum]RAR71314.1 putative oxidoreductase [Flavobacterium aciduliphilum]